MIEGGLAFVVGAYGVTVAGLIALVVSIVLRARHWARLARALDQKP